MKLLDQPAHIDELASLGEANRLALEIVKAERVKALRDERQIYVLTPENEKLLLWAFKNGGDQRIIKEALVLVLRAFVHQVAFRFWSTHRSRLERSSLEREDLITAGYEGVMRAVEKFDLLREGRLITYANRWIRQKMQRLIQNEARTIRLPVEVIEKIIKYHKLVKEDPGLTDEDLRRKLADDDDVDGKISQSRLDEIRKASLSTVSFDLPIHVDDDRPLSDRLSDIGAEDPADLIDSTRIAVVVQSVINGLPLDNQKRQILIKYFGLDGAEPVAMASIATDIGVSRARVQQILMGYNRRNGAGNFCRFEGVIGLLRENSELKGLLGRLV